MQRFPFCQRLEFRGVEPARDYTVPDGPERGSIKTRPARVKFEYESSDGDVGMLEINSNAFDRARGAVDWSKLKKGEMLLVEGHIVCPDDRPAYFTPAVVDREHVPATKAA